MVNKPDILYYNFLLENDIGEKLKHCDILINSKLVFIPTIITEIEKDVNESISIRVDFQGRNWRVVEYEKVEF